MSVMTEDGFFSGCRWRSMHGETGYGGLVQAAMQKGKESKRQRPAAAWLEISKELFLEIMLLSCRIVLDC